MELDCVLRAILQPHQGDPNRFLASPDTYKHLRRLGSEERKVKKGKIRKIRKHSTAWVLLPTQASRSPGNEKSSFSSRVVPASAAAAGPGAVHQVRREPPSEPP